MKAIFTIVLFCVSLLAHSGEYRVREVFCSKFGYYPKDQCLLLINGSEEAAVLVDGKFLSSRFPDLSKLSGSTVRVELESLLLVTLEEEESIRGYVDYPGVSYFGAQPSELTFISR